MRRVAVRSAARLCGRPRDVLHWNVHTVRALLLVGRHDGEWAPLRRGLRPLLHHGWHLPGLPALLHEQCVTLPPTLLSTLPSCSSCLLFLPALLSYSFLSLFSLSKTSSAHHESRCLWPIPPLSPPTHHTAIRGLHLTEALQEKYDIEEKKNMTILKSLCCPLCVMYQQIAEVLIQQDMEITNYGCCAEKYTEPVPKAKKAPKKAKDEEKGAPPVQEMER